MVERKTELVRITKLSGRGSAATVAALALRFRDVPRAARRTLTLDRGSENSDWESLMVVTGLRVFLAHAYRAWERGTNKNTNGLLRDYYPKGTDFTMIPEADLAHVERELNARPRKRLGYRTPQEAWG